MRSGEQQRAQEEEQGGITDHEQVDLERPHADALQAELEPPEMHDGQQQEECPGEMHEVDAIAHRVLDEPRQSGQQPRHREAGHDADDDPDMDELIVREVHGLRDRRPPPGCGPEQEAWEHAAWAPVGVLSRISSSYRSVRSHAKTPGNRVSRPGSV
jgi:hypothetical protein